MACALYLIKSVEKEGRKVGRQAGGKRKQAMVQKSENGVPITMNPYVLEMSFNLLSLKSILACSCKN